MTYSADKRVIAIGETGLDYHHPRKEQHRLKQLRWFIYQIKLASRLKLPLVLHIRKADDDALRVLKHYKKLLHGGVVHCFNYSEYYANEYIKLGFHLGIGGSLLQNDKSSTALEEVIKNVPLERILVETDAPYVLPRCNIECSVKQWQKTRNSSIIIPKMIIKRISELKCLDADEVENAVYTNTEKTFNIDIIQR